MTKETRKNAWFDLKTFIPFITTTIIGIGSLIGVYFGIKIKEKTKSTSYKKFVLLLNLFVLATMIYKTVEF